MKKLKIALISLGLFGLCFLAWKRTDGFRSSAITFSSDKTFPILQTDPPDNLTGILAQKFRYLGRGRQAFVFVSEDNQYVIKFFNFHHFYYPFGLKPPFLKDKTKRLDLTFSSYQLAFDKLPEETALIYVHLRQGAVKQRPKFKTKMQLINPVGVPIEIDLNQTYFVVQKKAAPFFGHLTDLAKEKNLPAGIDAFLQTIITRLNAKILDDDLDSGKNYGFLEGRAVNFDAGRLIEQKELPREMFVSELRKSTKMLFRWLKDNYPEQSAYLKRRELFFVEKLF